jgi:hypothetical protein
MQASKDPKRLVPPDLALPYSHRPVAGSQVPPISTAHWAEMLVHLAAAASAGAAPPEHIPIAKIANTIVRSIVYPPRQTITLFCTALSPTLSNLIPSQRYLAILRKAAPRFSGNRTIDESPIQLIG